MPTRSKPRVFVDADVMFAGSASPSEHGASLITLREDPQRETHRAQTHRARSHHSEWRGPHSCHREEHGRFVRRSGLRPRQRPNHHPWNASFFVGGEITLVDAVTSRQAITEAERNLSAKLPQALTTFRLLVERALRVVPAPSRRDLAAHKGIADPKDLPIGEIGRVNYPRVSAIRERCQWLGTFNVDDFQPGHPDVAVLRPGAFVQRVRTVLTHLDLTGE